LELDYIVAHLYETHDLWHVLTGFDTDPAGGVLQSASDDLPIDWNRAAADVTTAVCILGAAFKTKDVLEKGGASRTPSPHQLYCQWPTD
jgi:ubiquinone biosynthesis protein Coq4